MYHIDSQFESSTVGQRFSFKADMDFLQYGIREVIAGILESLIGSNYDGTKTYILKGCSVTSVGGTTTVSAGYMFGISKAYGGMTIPKTYLYYHPGSSFADPSGGNVVICKTVIANTSDDPTPFTDFVSRSVHEIVTVQFSAGASGSGDVNYTDLLYYNSFNDGGTPTVLSYTGGLGVIGSLNYNRFKLVGKTLDWQLSLVLGGAGACHGMSITVPIPSGYLIKYDHQIVLLIGDVTVGMTFGVSQFNNSGGVAVCSLWFPTGTTGKNLAFKTQIELQ